MVSHLSCVSLYHRTSVPIINKFLLAHIWLRIRNLIGLVLVYAIMSGYIYVLILLFQSVGMSGEYNMGLLVSGLDFSCY